MLRAIRAAGVLAPHRYSRRAAEGEKKFDKCVIKCPKNALKKCVQTPRYFFVIHA